jgi:hypothetical protein
MSAKADSRNMEQVAREQVFNLRLVVTNLLANARSCLSVQSSDQQSCTHFSKLSKFGRGIEQQTNGSYLDSVGSCSQVSVGDKLSMRSSAGSRLEQGCASRAPQHIIRGFKRNGDNANCQA